jgi:hypothetical protein
MWPTGSPRHSVFNAGASRGRPASAPQSKLTRVIETDMDLSPVFFGFRHRIRRAAGIDRTCGAGNGRRGLGRGVLVSVCGVLLLLGAGCGPEQDRIVQGKLKIILEDDLAEITRDIPEKALADSVFYSVAGYKTYEEGPFYALAVADFYFLRNAKYKIVRKYRYDRRKKTWERFLNEYRFYYHDSLRVRE